MLLEKVIKVEILGHQATLTTITPLLKQDWVWRKEDLLNVWLEFDEAVDGTLGFGFALPARICQDCTPEEFLYRVRKEGEKELAGIIKRSRLEREARKQKEGKERELDTIVQNIINRLSS